MQQNNVVYASHPAPHPSSSSSFVDYLQDVSLDAGRDIWSTTAAPISSRGDSLKEDVQQEDPLLATLDSLSLNSNENCPNTGLFGVLESLGWNAEELEVLLMDERMIMVNMDPDLSPSRSDVVSKHEGTDIRKKLILLRVDP